MADEPERPSAGAESVGGRTGPFAPSTSGLDAPADSGRSRSGGDSPRTTVRVRRPDTLNALLRSNGSSATPDDLSVTFTVADRQVTVHGSGEVVVRADSPGR